MLSQDGHSHCRRFWQDITFFCLLIHLKEAWLDSNMLLHAFFDKLLCIPWKSEMPWTFKQVPEFAKSQFTIHHAMRHTFRFEAKMRHPMLSLTLSNNALQQFTSCYPLFCHLENACINTENLYTMHDTMNVIDVCFATYMTHARLWLTEGHGRTENVTWSML